MIAAELINLWKIADTDTKFPDANLGKLNE